MIDSMRHASSATNLQQYYGTALDSTSSDLIINQNQDHQHQQFQINHNNNNLENNFSSNNGNLNNINSNFNSNYRKGGGGVAVEMDQSQSQQQNYYNAMYYGGAAAGQSHQQQQMNDQMQQQQGLGYQGQRGENGMSGMGVNMNPYGMGSMGIGMDPHSQMGQFMHPMGNLNSLAMQQNSMNLNMQALGMPESVSFLSPSSQNTYNNQATNFDFDQNSSNYDQGNISPKNDQSQDPQKSSLYKTEMCRKWTSTGSCRYGNKCQFAHGGEELRMLVRHPLYKTTMCKSYQATGACRYGSRCRFIHNETQYQLQNVPRFPMGGEKALNVSFGGFHPNTKLVPEPLIQQELTQRHQTQNQVQRQGFNMNDPMMQSFPQGQSPERIRFSVEEMENQNSTVNVAKYDYIQGDDDLDDLQGSFANMQMASVRRVPSAPANLNEMDRTHSLDSQSKNMNANSQIARMPPSQGNYFDEDFPVGAKNLAMRRNITHHGLRDLAQIDKNPLDMPTNQNPNINVAMGLSKAERERFQISAKYKHLSASLNDMSPKWANPGNNQDFGDEEERLMPDNLNADHSVTANIYGNVSHISNSQISQGSLSNAVQGQARSQSRMRFAELDTLAEDASHAQQQEIEYRDNMMKGFPQNVAQRPSSRNFNNQMRKDSRETENTNGSGNSGMGNQNARLDFFRSISDPDLADLNDMMRTKNA